MLNAIRNASASTAVKPIASTESTVRALLEDHRRPGPPIRQIFLQERGGDRAPGKLHVFVRERKLFALRLYLLLHCLALGDPWDSVRPAAVYARALGKPMSGGLATVSRA